MSRKRREPNDSRLGQRLAPLLMLAIALQPLRRQRYTANAAYFRVFTKVVTALASSAVRPERAFLCGAFLASSPLVSRSVI